MTVINEKAVITRNAMFLEEVKQLTKPAMAFSKKLFLNFLYI